KPYGSFLRRQTRVLRRNGDMQEQGEGYQSAEHDFLRGLPNRVRNVVDDDVGFGVAQNQVLADDSIFHFLWKRREIGEKVRRDSWKRRSLWIFRVHFQHHATWRIVLYDLL